MRGELLPKFDMDTEKKIRVLLVAEGDSWGGIESHIKYLVPHYRGMQSFYFEFLLFSEGDLGRWLRGEGFRVTIVPRDNRYLRVKRVHAFLKNHQFDIIHTHSTVTAFYIGINFFSFKRSAWINTQHGKSEKVTGLRKIRDRFSQKIVDTIMRYLRRASVICVSNDLSEWIIKATKIPKSKITVILNGVNFEQLESKKDPGIMHSLGISNKDYVACIVGRLVSVKGHIYLFEAIRELVRESDQNDSNFKLLVIGDGPLNEKLERHCEAHGIRNNVLFLGRRDDVKELLLIADVVIIPSIHEGIPYLLLEAMGLGKPIIASNVGGLKEVLKDNFDAILVPTEDVQALKNAIVKIEKHPDLATRLASNAKMVVQQSFSSKRMAEETVEEYKRRMLKFE